MNLNEFIAQITEDGMDASTILAHVIEQDEQIQNLVESRKQLRAENEALKGNYLRAVDEALVCSHLGTAEPTDSYEEAKRKLNQLICYEAGVREYFEAEALRAQIAEARADERQAMAYLSEVRAIVGGDDFPDMIKRVEALRAYQVADAMLKAREEGR